ncbi:MarR family winged helix-turn-helix transcriptional regulator [Saccharopolyspora phatthalungensis]|uniref:DNA-binding MarR family transcriptional regulator n=1 Tax=Saccharopolyspora phatthalungensis TaxID=664693 RepID=A0A840QDK0_9PSEU|nr:MarR family transcriptional regulator [Saccharopolyspora phatthalungensis]MBB5156639.1 DNA-binding MarR family transcriptional regulator [Saccharopolyspora phatthalungensis]
MGRGNMGSELSADSQLDRDVCKLVHQFAQTLDIRVRRVAEELGLTSTQVVALRELSEPITARELATRMSCEASNATFVLDRLEQQGLIERRPHPTDRRAKQIVLTPSGRRSRTTVLKNLNSRSPLTPLTDAQQKTLRNLLRALVAER